MARLMKDVTKFNMDKFLQQQIKEERQEQIYQMVKLRSQVRRINRALAALRKAGYYDESIAVENLVNQLTSKAVGLETTSSGNISLTKLKIGKVSITKQTAIQKSLEQFIKNKTSTIKGMEVLYEERKYELKRMFENDDFVDNLSNKDIRTIYSVFQSNEYKALQSRMGSPEFFVLYTQAIDQKKDKDWFLREMSKYMESGQDEDLKESLSDIYDNYISKYTNR